MMLAIFAITGKWLSTMIKLILVANRWPRWGRSEAASPSDTRSACRMVGKSESGAKPVAAQTQIGTANGVGLCDVERWLDWLEATGRQPTAAELAAALDPFVGNTDDKR